MDKRVAALKTPDECAGFVKNAIRLGRPDLAQEARRYAVELNARTFATQSDLEREIVEAVYAYEAVLTAARGRKARATRTWQMIQKHGIVPAIERAVSRGEEAADYATLLEMGLERHAFEAIVIRHPDAFSAEALKRATERAAQWPVAETTTA